MRRVLIPVFAATFSFSSCAAQTSTHTVKSPKTVVEEFLAMETRGGRTTPQGWRLACSYFSKPCIRPPGLQVYIISKDYLVWPPIVKGTSTTAEITAEIEPGGDIDPELRFTPPSRRFYKYSLLYRLVLTDKRWELNAEGTTAKEVKGLPEWRIDDSGDTLVLDVDSAVRYVQQRRDKTADPNIKRNASQTLEQLKKVLHRTSAR